MTTNPNQGQRPDPADKYGGYTGYRPPNPVDDPYEASQEGRSQQSDPNYVYGQQGQGQQSNDGQEQQQQQSSYEPPQSVRGRQGRRSSGTSTPFASPASQGSVEKDDRKFALYSYLGFCFTGIVFFFLKKKRPFVRFHAAQSIVLFVPIAAVLVVLKIISIITLIPIIGVLFGFVINFLISLVVVPAAILWIALMVLSYQGIRVKLPIVGHYAEALMARFSSD